MNDSTRVTRRRSLAWPRTLRTLAAVFATAAVAVLAAACAAGASSIKAADSSNAEGTTNSHQVAFSRCMRSHGVPNFPDPTESHGGKAIGFQMNGVDPNTQQFRTAQKVCRSLSPLLGGG